MWLVDVASLPAGEKILGRRISVLIPATHSMISGTITEYRLGSALAHLTMTPAGTKALSLGSALHHRRSSGTLKGSAADNSTTATAAGASPPPQAVHSSRHHRSGSGRSARGSSFGVTFQAAASELHSTASFHLEASAMTPLIIDGSGGGGASGSHHTGQPPMHSHSVSGSSSHFHQAQLQHMPAIAPHPSASTSSMSIAPIEGGGSSVARSMTQHPGHGGPSSSSSSRPAFAPAPAHAPSAYAVLPRSGIVSAVSLSPRPLKPDPDATVKIVFDEGEKQVVRLRDLRFCWVEDRYKGTPPAPGVVGLVNMGNTCYLNAILQCLSHVQQLSAYVLDPAFSSHINISNKLGMQGRFAVAYHDLMEQLWGSQANVLVCAPAKGNGSATAIANASPVVSAGEGGADGAVTTAGSASAGAANGGASASKTSSSSSSSRASVHDSTHSSNGRHETTDHSSSSTSQQLHAEETSASAPTAPVPGTRGGAASHVGLLSGAAATGGGKTTAMLTASKNAEEKIAPAGSSIATAADESSTAAAASTSPVVNSSGSGGGAPATHRHSADSSAARSDPQSSEWGVTGAESAAATALGSGRSTPGALCARISPSASAAGASSCQYIAVAPAFLKALLSERSSAFNGMGQQDAQEALFILLNSVHEDLAVADDTATAASAEDAARMAREDEVERSEKEAKERTAREKAEKEARKKDAKRKNSGAAPPLLGTTFGVGGGGAPAPTSPVAPHHSTARFSFAGEPSAATAFSSSSGGIGATATAAAGGGKQAQLSSILPPLIHTPRSTAAASAAAVPPKSPAASDHTTTARASDAAGAVTSSAVEHDLATLPSTSTAADSRAPSVEITPVPSASALHGHPPSSTATLVSSASSADGSSSSVSRHSGGLLLSIARPQSAAAAAATEAERATPGSSQLPTAPGSPSVPVAFAAGSPPVIQTPVPSLMSPSRLGPGGASTAPLSESSARNGGGGGGLFWWGGVLGGRKKAAPAATAAPPGSPLAAGGATAGGMLRTTVSGAGDDEATATAHNITGSASAHVSTESRADAAAGQTASLEQEQQQQFQLQAPLSNPSSSTAPTFDTAAISGRASYSEVAPHPSSPAVGPARDGAMSGGGASSDGILIMDPARLSGQPPLDSAAVLGSASLLTTTSAAVTSIAAVPTASSPMKRGLASTGNLRAPGFSLGGLLGPRKSSAAALPVLSAPFSAPLGPGTGQQLGDDTSSGGGSVAGNGAAVFFTGRGKTSESQSLHDDASAATPTPPAAAGPGDVSSTAPPLSLTSGPALLQHTDDAAVSASSIPLAASADSKTVETRPQGGLGGSSAIVPATPRAAQPYVETTSIVKQLFFVQMQTEFTCVRSKHVSVLPGPRGGEMPPPLPLIAGKREVRTGGLLFRRKAFRDPVLTDCLDDYFCASESVMRKCEKCGKVTNVMQRPWLKALPPVLTIHLKRFEFM